MLFYGVKERKSAFVMAYMVLQMIGIVLCVIGMAIMFFAVLYLTANPVDPDDPKVRLLHFLMPNICQKG